MDEHAPHRGQLASVGGALALDALPVGLHRDRVRTGRRPAPYVADAVANGLPGGAHDFVCPIQLPHTVFAHHDTRSESTTPGGTASVVLLGSVTIYCVDAA